ncbi:MAG: SAM-dependent chlorinase/fluorinase [Deltaproteobacteria bacterium]|nr:SAM-dependent chlorinase/fluorinase [Deltaproteobacteria bacterium]
MVIALLSDFGLEDHYVGSMKGVLARLAPAAKVVDLGHQIAPYDRIQGGLLLYQTYPYFPPKTIFVAVVDPGVGSARKGILVETDDYFFLGPDNGLLSMALGEQKIRRIFDLSHEKYFLDSVSPTFHGRDIFAPVAAHLALGVAPESFGEELTDYQRLPAFVPSFNTKEITGQILAFDRFGNAISNLSRKFFNRHYQKPTLDLKVGGRNFECLHTHYAAVPSGEGLALFGGGDLLEIAVHQGSAEKIFSLKRGDTLRLAL